MANKTITGASISSIATDTGSVAADFVTADQTITISGACDVSAGSGAATLGIWLTGGVFGAGTLVGSVLESTAAAGIGWSFDLTTSGVISAQNLAAGSYSIVVTDGTTSVSSPLA